MMPFFQRSWRAPLFRAVLWAGALLFSRTARAQLDVDQVPHERIVPTSEAIQGEMETSRFNLGSLRLIPMVEFSNAGYEYNVYSRAQGEPIISDWTATIGAGGVGILPLGSKFFLRALALPSYIWYDQLKDRRTWGGDFSGSFMALGNRLSLVLAGSLDKGSAILNSETLVTVIRTTTDGSGNLEVNLTNGIVFLTGAEIQEQRNSPLGQDPVNPIEVHNLDRTDAALLAGLRWRLLPFLDISAGVQGTRTEFVETPELRNNQSLAYLGGVRLDRSSYFLNLAVGYRKAEPFQGSLFQNYSTTIGSYYLGWDVARPVQLQAFGYRHPVYSVYTFDQLYLESRFGGGVALRLGSRLAVRGYGQVGTNTYPFEAVAPGDSRRRTDDAVRFGGNVSVLVVGTMVLRAEAYQDSLKSNVPGNLDRTIVRFYTGLSFNGKLTQ